MHASPEVINEQQLMVWVKWMLRNHSGRFVLVYGRQRALEHWNWATIDQKFGPCGPNPFAYFKIFRLTETIDDTEDEIKPDDRDLGYYSMLEMQAKTLMQRDPSRFIREGYSNNGQFKGFGMMVDAPVLSNDEKLYLEQEMVRVGLIKAAVRVPRQDAACVKK